jgi:serine/threonine-protein kinase
MVYMGPSPQGVQLWVHQRDQLDATPIPGTEAAAAPFFSPDGLRVGFLNVGRQSLHAVTLDGGAMTTLVPSEVRRVGASWGSDGIVYVDEKRGLVRLKEGEPSSQATVLLGLDRVADPRWPHVLPGGKGVLFTRAAASGGGDFEIMALAGPGAEPRALVRGVVGFYAPNGYLFYVTPASELMAVPFDLDRLERTGTPAVLARDVELQFGAVDLTLSQRGTLIYGTAPTARDLAELVWTDRQGTTRVLDAGWRGDFQAVAISPDGKRIAATIIDGEQMDVWIKPLAGGSADRLSIGSEGRSFRATWHPDGRLVGFIVERRDTRQFFQRNADGSGGTMLGFSESVNQATWSNDGQWLIYRTGRVDDLNIHARRLADGTTIELATLPNANEHSPTLSPDNRWLAFVSNRSGQWEVYVRPFPRASEGEWQVSVGGATEPKWSHNGRELFYKQGGQMMAADVVPGNAFGVANRRALFSLEGYYNFAFHPTYDVAPDDRHFVMIRSRHFGPSFDLVVIEHLEQELAASPR